MRGQSSVPAVDDNAADVEQAQDVADECLSERARPSRHHDALSVQVQRRLGEAERARACSQKGFRIRGAHVRRRFGEL